MRTVKATRYVTPLVEGGSVPAVFEADDDGTYVVKFRGAAQGERASIAEIVAGEIGRELGLPVPGLVLVELESALGRSEPHFEIQRQITSSDGVNIALDFLPGALNWEPALAPPPDPEMAARIVWFDAFVENVDRTVRNPNMLRWHKRLYLIDHGACLYWHHDWPEHLSRAQAPFAMSRQHVLLPLAGDVRAADAVLAPMITREVLERVLGDVPDAWLTAGETAEDTRAGYIEHLWQRVSGPRAFVEEAERARLAV